MARKCLYCSPKVCGEYWIYVVADKDGTGPVKVGISNNPTRRLGQHRKKTKRDLIVHFKVPVQCQFRAFDVEEYALESLDDFRTTGDWFSAPIAQCIDAVNRAMRNA